MRTDHLPGSNRVRISQHAYVAPSGPASMPCKPRCIIVDLGDYISELFLMISFVAGIGRLNMEWLPSFLSHAISGRIGPRFSLKAVDT